MKLDRWPRGPVLSSLRVVLVSLLSFPFVSQAMAVGGKEQTFAMLPHPFLQAHSVNFSLNAMEELRVTPACLRQKGYRLLLIDPGHDDSELSRRSEARRDEGSSQKEFLRPRVHEGHLNQQVAWMVYDLLLRGRGLSLDQRRELTTMIRFTRHPGEVLFGEYELQQGYSSAHQGGIDHTTTNRVERVNFAMSQHRPFDPRHPLGWGDVIQDVRNETLFVSIHSNNSGGVYDDADYAWLITDPESHLGSLDYVAARKVAESFHEVLPNFLRERPWDTAFDKALRFESRFAFDLANAKIKPVDRPLKLMSRMVGTENTTKFLTEAFFMTGKVGHLVHRELENPNLFKALRFYRGVNRVAEYQVSELYIHYAQALALGLSRYLHCEEDSD